MFSLIVVLLNFRKYRRSVLFPRIVESALIGLVLYLCHDFSCRHKFSSVVGLFISFLTSGLSFVKNCWGQFLW